MVMFVYMIVLVKNRELKSGREFNIKDTFRGRGRLQVKT
jgi:hypothetical protein